MGRGEPSTDAKNLIIRHNDGVIYKNNHNSFFIWGGCTEEKRIKLFQQFLTDKNGDFIEEEYVLIAKPGIDKLAKYLLIK